MTHDISERTRRHEVARSFIVELRHAGSDLTARARIWQRVYAAGVHEEVEEQWLR